MKCPKCESKMVLTIHGYLCLKCFHLEVNNETSPTP
jgi:hypothetical protein